jgi:hypothetical protein
MIELESTLANISFNDLIKSINNIKNRHRFLSLTHAEERKACMNILMYDNDTYIVIKYTGMIEWTPVKLCQSIFYMVKYNDDIWTIKYTMAEGLVARYYINIYNILLSTICINDNTLNRANIIWPSYSIIHSALTELLTNMNKYIKVSTTRDYIKNTKYIHYMILYNNIIYYIVYTEHKSIFFIYPYY